VCWLCDGTRHIGNIDVTGFFCWPVVGPEGYIEWFGWSVPHNRVLVNEKTEGSLSIYPFLSVPHNGVLVNEKTEGSLSVHLIPGPSTGTLSIPD
jgi:hypothetical protein